MNNKTKVEYVQLEKILVFSSSPFPEAGGYVVGGIGKGREV